MNGVKDLTKNPELEQIVYKLNRGFISNVEFPHFQPSCISVRYFNFDTKSCGCYSVDINQIHDIRKHIHSTATSVLVRTNLMRLERELAKHEYWFNMWTFRWLYDYLLFDD